MTEFFYLNSIIKCSFIHFVLYIDELAKVKKLMPQQLIVPPDELQEEPVWLQISYARFLRGYKKVLQDSAEAQEEFVKTVPGVIRRELRPDHTFQS